MCELLLLSNELNSLRYSIILWLFCERISENFCSHEMTDREYGNKTHPRTTITLIWKDLYMVSHCFHILYCMLRWQVNQSDMYEGVCNFLYAVEYIVRLNKNITLFFALSFSYSNVSGSIHSFPFSVAHIQLFQFSTRTNSPPRLIPFHLFSSSALSLADSRIVVKVHRHANLKHMDTTWNGNRFVTPIEYTIFAPETQAYYIIRCKATTVHRMRTRFTQSNTCVCLCFWLCACVSECILCQTDNGNDADDAMVIILFATY